MLSFMWLTHDLECSKIVIDLDDVPQEMQWTLGRHIHLSNVKYPLKAKYYCVHNGDLDDMRK